jgi:glucosamine kinase
MDLAGDGRGLVIGVDGGGSRCRVRIEDVEGRRMGSGIGGPAAVRFGIDRLMAEVETACRSALAQADLPVEALRAMDAAIGLAGLSRKGALEQLMAHAHPFRSVRYVDDALIACVGAHGGHDGGIVIIGTGSVGLAVVEGREVRVGGYGFPISDEGSGAALGLQAIRLALRAGDGRAVTTNLTREVMAHFGDDPYEVVSWMDHATATDYAMFAPLVMRHADGGDAVGRMIVSEAAEHIGELVFWLAKNGAHRIALSGGLAPSMERWLASDVQRRLSAIQGDALDGALNLARRAATIRKC